MSGSRRCCAVLAIAAAAAAGCATTVVGHHEPGAAARQATDLNALLLTADEIDSAMNATGMAVDTTVWSMALSRKRVSCTPMKSAEYFLSTVARW